MIPVSAMKIRLGAARGREGYALMMTLLLVLAVGVLALGAVSVVGNASLINAYESRRTELEALADAGLEVARARLNQNPALYPASGFATLENGVALTDANNQSIGGVKRYLYVGPVGQTTGQFGVSGSIISVVEAGNTRVVRRGDIGQETFAKYAYFTDIEPSNIAFGGGDQISGPVHTNDLLKIYDSGATFRGPGQVTTAKYIDGKKYGKFLDGYDEYVAKIPMPSTANLTSLKSYATNGGTAFTAATGGGTYQAMLRIEFLVIDVNGDGNFGEDEGFFRVYKGANANWVMATLPTAWENSENCVINESGIKRIADVSGTAAQKRTKANNSKCYLGGDPKLYNDTFPSKAVSGEGEWMKRPFSWTGTMPTAISNRKDKDFLFPLSSAYNSEFKGVIHVTGKVAISGVVRGRVTLAATDRILIADDLTYATQGASGCDPTLGDILGLFGGTEIVVVDNTLNTPQRPTGSGSYYTLDDTGDEFINGVILALTSFTVEDYDGGPSTGQSCQGTAWGRGCLFLTGGIIQKTRGGVGTSGGTGYLKRYAYDACAATNPPPYFPTTGHFDRGRYYEIDPVGFTAGEYFNMMTPR